MVPDEKRPGDGRHIGYLKPNRQNLRRFRDCDPNLYDALGGIVEDKERRVASVHERGVLPEGTVFYEAPLTFRDMPAIGPEAKRKRLEHREAWAQGAREANRGCDVVFADPDNGFEVASVQRHHGRAPKYVFFDEVEPYIGRGQSLVVYQQVSHVSVKKRVEERFSDIREHFGQTKGHSDVFALHHRPGSARAFFVVPSDAHRDILTERAKRFVWDACWGEHFTLVEPGQ